MIYPQHPEFTPGYVSLAVTTADETRIEVTAETTPVAGLVIAPGMTEIDGCPVFGGWWRLYHQGSGRYVPVPSDYLEPEDIREVVDHLAAAGLDWTVPVEEMDREQVGAALTAAAASTSSAQLAAAS
jgi:hypothetical protein